MLSPSTRNEDFVSLNPDGGKGAYDSKIDDGQTASSSLGVSHLLNPPPYTRIVLMTIDSAGSDCGGDDTLLAAQTLPPSLLLQAHVSLEEWRDLWSRVQPKIDAMKSHSKKSATMLESSYLLFLLLSLPLITLSHRTIALFFLLYSIFSGVLLTGIFGISRLQKKNYENLRKLFREEEDRVFRQNGVIIECECEWCDVYPSLIGMSSAYVVYFLPLKNNDSNESQQNDDNTFDDGTRNGYLRVQLFADDPTFCGNGRNALFLWHLASYRTLPTAFSTDLTTMHLWDRFWPRMIEMSHEFGLQTSRIRTPVPILLVFWLLVCISYGVLVETDEQCDVEQTREGCDVPVFVFVVLYLSLMIACIMSTNARHKCQCIRNQRLELVQRFAPKFAKLGLWVELRCLKLTDLESADYLYLFRLPHREASV